MANQPNAIRHALKLLAQGLHSLACEALDEPHRCDGQDMDQHAFSASQGK
jgi:hypothetical protein